MFSIIHHLVEMTTRNNNNRKGPGRRVVYENEQLADIDERQAKSIRRMASVAAADYLRNPPKGISIPTMQNQRSARPRNNRKNFNNNNKNESETSLPSTSPLSTFDLKRGNYNVMWNKYLNGLLDPKLTDQFIPDFNMFPFTTLQSKTVVEVTSSSAGAFLLLATPYMTETGFLFNGSIAPATSPSCLVNGVSYGPSAVAGNIFANTVYPSVKVPAQSYRIVSMQFAVNYIAPTITAQGRAVTACLPPTTIGAYNLNDFTALANYNYAYNDSALKGATQIWFPDGPNSQTMINIAASGTSLDLPFLAIACDGLVPLTKVMTITITQNYEIFSTAQILTAPRGSRVTSSTSIDHASTTMSTVYQSNGGGHAGGGHEEHQSFLHQALKIGGEIAKTALPIIATMFA